METWMSGGIGRAQGAYDEMKFRSLVRDGQPFYSNLGLAAEGTAADFQTMTNAYFYGTRFVSYLAYTYSPQHVIEWMKRGEGSKRYYADQFEQVFGKPLEDAWDDWIAFETEFQRKNLESVHQEPLTPTKPLVTGALARFRSAYVDTSRQFLIEVRYWEVTALGALPLDDSTTRG
jgi:hypothetical protein